MALKEDKESKPERRPGVAVDAHGLPVIDPTKNVLDLVQAESRRQDGLREAFEKMVQSQMQGREIVDQLRATHADRINEAESRRVNEQLTLRAAYEERLALAEAKRIDAIRAVDVNAVAVASQRASDQATVLACVSEDTPILCADLIWRPAGHLQVGDELIAFDEEPIAPRANESLNETISRGRQYRRSVVTANSLHEDDLLLVDTPRGQVRCNREHPWLARRPYSKEVKWTWVRADHLRPGDSVMHAVDVWEVDRSWEAGWLAGIIDGEGCLNTTSSQSGNSRLTVVQADGVTANMIKDAMEWRVETFHVRRRKDVPNRKPKSDFVVNSKSDILKMLGSVRPARLLADSDKVWDGRFIGGLNRATTVTAIIDAGVGVIASLSTSTKTYIAGGFAMHNTQVAQSAEALRGLVASTANTVAQSQQVLSTTLSTRITTLEQAQYEGKGKQSFADPAFAELLNEVKNLRESRAIGAGKGEGISTSWAIFLSAATLGLAILGAVLMFNRGPTTSPQVIYAPAPAVATPLVK